MIVTVPPYPNRRFSCLVAVRVSFDAAAGVSLCCATDVDINASEASMVRAAMRKPTLNLEFEVILENRHTSQPSLRTTYNGALNVRTEER